MIVRTLQASAGLLVLSLVLPAAFAQQPPVTKPEPAKLDPKLRLTGHTSEVFTVVFSPDGKRLASCSNSDVRVWDLATGKELYTYPTKGTNVYGLAFSPDGKRLAVGVSKQIRLLEAD